MIGGLFDAAWRFAAGAIAATAVAKTVAAATAVATFTTGLASGCRGGGRRDRCLSEGQGSEGERQGE